MNARHSTEQASLFAIATPDRTASEIEVLRHAAIRARDQAIAEGVINFFSSLGRGLAFLGRTVASWPARQSAYQSLRNLTDRELADIGITRSEIAHVFDPDFRTPAPKTVSQAKPATVVVTVTTVHTPANANSPLRGTAAAA